MRIKCVMNIFVLPVQWEIRRQFRSLKSPLLRVFIEFENQTMAFNQNHRHICIAFVIET